MSHHRDPSVAGTASTVVDLTPPRSVTAGVQAVVEEIEAVFGGGPWAIRDVATGALLAVTSAEPFAGEQTIPLHGTGLELLTRGGIDVDESSPTIARLSTMLGAVVSAERRAAEAEARATVAERLATRDSLTGLIGQGEWWRRIDQIESRAEREPRDLVLAVVDLDGLKEVNDERGHLHGDLLIRMAAEALCSATRGGDIVARVGGDEFAVLAPDHHGSAAALADRLGAALSQAGITASVGAAFHPGGSLRETFAAADRRMYDHKARRAAAT